MQLNLYYHDSTIGVTLVRKNPHFHDCNVCIWECGKERLICTIGTSEVETLSMRSFSDYIIHFWMVKAHKSPLAAVCTGVHEEE